MMKVLKKTAFILLCLATILYITLDIYIYRCYKKSEPAINETVKIYSYYPDQEIPENIIQAYEKVYPGTLTSNIYPDLLWAIINLRHTTVQIHLARRINRFSNPFETLSIANQLDNTLTIRQCIFAELMTLDFCNNTIGIKEAAQNLYQKDIPHLTERECIELCVMTKNPTIYNKRKRPQRIKEVVDRVIREAPSNDTIK